MKKNSPYTHHSSILCNYINSAEIKIELFPGYTLEKASGKLLEEIKYCLGDKLKGPIHRNPFESFVVDKNVHPYKMKYCKNESEWQYWTIRHNTQYMSDPAKYALHISEAEFNPILIIHHQPSNPNWKVSNHSIHHHLYQAINEQQFSTRWATITPETLLSLRNNYLKLTLLNKIKYEFIFNSLNEYAELRKLPYDSPFKILGLLAIIENLITDGNMNFRTIKHQLKSKFILLNNRFAKSFDLTQIFKGANTDTNELIIQKIYDYRSKIAHGGKVDFQDELKLLGNKEKVYNVLNSITKCICTLGINEPQLLADLKKC